VHWNAEDYARNSGAQASWARELIAKLELAGAETVLDLGCGDGKVTAEIAALIPEGHVLGVDSSVAMVDLARRSFPPATNPNLTFEIADARSLSFRERFDIVFSNAVLHWVVDHGPVLSGVARALRQGGRLLFQCGGRGNGEEFFAVAGAMVTEPAWRELFHGFAFPWGFYGPEEYEPWCRKAGLVPRRIELLPRVMKQKGAAGLAGWVRTTWMPYTDRLPEDRREDFIREACERYLSAHPLDENGNASVLMSRLEVEAVKAGPRRP
jgi:trans-aconitate 2-methyltransferase